MGPKKETLLRWVNCCFEDEAPVDKIKNLSEGAFFLRILTFLRSHYTMNGAPWLQIVTILRDHNITDEIIDFDGAASGNEDELAKLIVACMHLTMVQRPCEMIKEKTMMNLSTEDQKVLETILTAIVNDDAVTRARLTEVLQDSGSESSHSKPMTFYTSSPISSMPRNSPLKRFLDSPMALRLSRLQREINDKNEEIRRLQSEIIAESDESTALRHQMEELNRRVKDMEKRNAELTQRLRDCQIPESTQPGADVEINQLKKQLKKLQNEYELSCQKYCDLNLEHEALKARQEKDRKQIRQLQVELNEAVARFERESAEYQLLLDSIRTENVELKHTLEEKTQWIDVLEERNRNYSETHSRMMITPRSPCERESIGFSLLSIETEKLQFEIETCRRELASQSNSFEVERQQYQQQVGTLQLENSQLTRQVEETAEANTALHGELQEAKTSLDQLTQGCNNLRQEKDTLAVSLESLNEKFQHEMERAQHQLDLRVTEAQQLGLRIESLSEQLGQTLALKEALEQSIALLEKEKLETAEALRSVKQANQHLESTLAAKELEYKQHIEVASSKIEELQGEVCVLKSTATKLEQEKSCLSSEKEQLELEVRELRSEIERSAKDFQSRLDMANSSLEEASSRIMEFTKNTSHLQQQLDEALKEKAHFEKLSAELEAHRVQLSAEREALQQEVAKLLASAQLSRDEFMTEKSQLLDELDAKKKEIAEKLNSIHVAEKRHEEAVEQVERLEFSVRTLENDVKELLESKNYFEQQAASLQVAVEEGKNQLVAFQSQAKEEAAHYELQVNQGKEEIKTLEVQIETITREKSDLEQQIAAMSSNNDTLSQQITCLQQAGEEAQLAKSELEGKLVALQEESMQRQEEQQASIREQSDKICILEEKLLQSVQHQNDLTSRLQEVTSEKLRMVEEKDCLASEVSRLASLLEQEKAAFEASLSAVKGELETKQSIIEAANEKILAIESELAQISAQKSTLENQVQLMADERRELLEQRSSLEQNNRQLDALKREQQDEHSKLVERLSGEHDERIQELTKQLEDAQQRSVELTSKCVQLECEREALTFEKSNFEQMYLEVKSACEEAEAKILVESELARKDAEAKESMLQQQSEALCALQETLDNLRQEKAVVESAKTQRILELEAELEAMKNDRNRLEQERCELLSSSEASLRELELKLTSVSQTLSEKIATLQQTDAMRHQAEEQRNILASEIEKLKIAAESELEEKTQLLKQITNLERARASAQHEYTEEVNRLQMEIAIRQQQVDEERETLRATEDLLHNSNHSMKDLEVAMEQLSSDIEELSYKKATLEQMRESLEIEKASAEEEINQLREELETKDLQITKLSEKIKTVEFQLDQAKQENQSLHARIADLEARKHDTVATLEKQLQECELTLEQSASELTAEKERAAQAQANFLKALSDLRSSNDGNRRELEVTIAGLRRELEAEQQRCSEHAGSISELKSTRQEMSELVESLQRQLTEYETEKDTLQQVNAKLEEKTLRFEEMNKSQRIDFEMQKSDLQSTLLSHESKIEELSAKLADNCKVYDDLKVEYLRLKDTHQLCASEKASLEVLSRSSEKEFESAKASLQKQTEDLESQLKLKVTEISKLSEIVDSLKQELERAKKEKRAIEVELSGRMSTLTLEKENLLKKQAMLEQENRQLKAELSAEKEKTSAQTKGETTLEHRKEKAALEARLQLAQAQVKSMQEKLVDMTVANNSHAPLEHRITVLTNELETVSKAKTEMEKQLKEALERVNSQKTSNISVEDDKQKAATDAELDALRKKYDATKKTLIYKEEVIGQYAKKFEKMQAQLDSHDEQVSTLNAENRKLTYENRTLKTEQHHLLAQIAAEKDKANAKASRHSLALQRGLAASDGGTLADAMVDARRRTLRSTKSEVVSTSSGRRSPDGEIFRPPSLAFGDGSDANSIFKVPPSRRESFNRRDSVNSVCSTRSDASTASRVPQGAGRFFHCDDEDGEQFSNLYLNEMKEGKCKLEDTNARLSELHRRNTMQPPHMRSAYPAEMNDERLRCTELHASESKPKVENLNDSVNQLSEATSMLSMHTPPAMNTRKRRSSSWNTSEMETPVLQPSKRRSQDDANMSTDSGHSTNRSVLSSAERRKHRDASQTTYQRPGPPTPGKNPLRENNSILSNNSPPKNTPKQTPKQSSKLGSKQSTPSQPSKSAKLTPGALVRKVQAKIRSNKLLGSENTPTATTPRSRSKLNVFRKPLGSRGYSSDAKF